MRSSPALLLAAVALALLPSADFAQPAADRPIAKLPGPAGTAVAFSRDGKLLLTAGGDEARVWDADTFEPVFAPLKHDAPVEAAAFGPDGARLFTCAGAKALAWDARTGGLLYSLNHPDRVADVVVSPDARTVCTACLDGSARLWDVATGRLRAELKHGQPVRSVSFSRDGVRLLTGSLIPAADGRLDEWDKRNAADRDDAFAPGLAHVWDVVRGEELCVVPTDWGWCRGRPAFSPDATRIAVPLGPAGAVLCNIETGNYVAVWRFVCGMKGIVIASFNGDGRRLLIAGDDGADDVDNALHVMEVVPDGRFGLPGHWTPNRFERVLGLLPLRSTDAAAISPDGTTVAATFPDPSFVGDRHVLGAWDVATGRQVLDVTSRFDPQQVRRRRAPALSFSPDGKRIAAGFASDGFTGVWEVPERPAP
jgi:WD40 repeat protein